MWAGDMVEALANWRKRGFVESQRDCGIGE